MSNLLHANYLVIPRASYESWEYLPVTFTNKVNAGNYWAVLPETQLYQFGVMNSAMHMAWIKCVSGKLQCYDRVHFNPTMRNFPWPISHTQAHIKAIEAKTLSLLQVRAQYPATPLAELYDPATMPVALRQAHAELDKAVDAAYGQSSFTSDDSRIGFLLNYQRKLASLLVTLSDELTVFAPVKQAAIPEKADFGGIAARKSNGLASTMATF